MPEKPVWIGANKEDILNYIEQNGWSTAGLEEKSKKVVYQQAMAFYKSAGGV